VVEAISIKCSIRVVFAQMAIFTLNTHMITLFSEVLLEPIETKLVKGPAEASQAVARTFAALNMSFQLLNCVDFNILEFGALVANFYAVHYIF